MDFCDVSIKLPLQLIQHVAKYPQDWETVATAQVADDQGEVIKTDFAYENGDLHCRLTGKCSEMFTITDDHFKFKLAFVTNHDLYSATAVQPYYKGCNFEYVIGDDGLCYIQYESESEQEESNEPQPQNSPPLNIEKSVKNKTGAKASTTKQKKAKFRQRKVRLSASGSSSEGSTYNDCSSGDEWLPQSENKAKKLKSKPLKTKKKQICASKPPVHFKKLPTRYPLQIKKEVSSAQTYVQKLKTKVIQYQFQKEKKKLASQLNLKNRTYAQWRIEKHENWKREKLQHKLKRRRTLEREKKLRREELEKEKEVQSEVNFLQCKHCYIRVRNEKQLKEHEERLCRVLHPHVKAYKSYGRVCCSRCNLSKQYKHELEEHKLTCDFHIVCEECGQSFDVIRNYWLHIRIKHGRNKPVRQCPICGKAVHHHYNAHVKRHTEKWLAVCDVCGRGFTDKSRLNLHMSVHTGIYKRQCDRCGYGMNTLKEMKRHKCGRTRRRRYRNTSLADKGDNTATDSVKPTGNTTSSSGIILQEHPGAQMSNEQHVSASGSSVDIGTQETPPAPVSTQSAMTQNFPMNTSHQMYTTSTMFANPLYPFYHEHYQN